MLNFQPSLEQLLQIAADHHQAGRLSEAETLYRQILTQHPRQVEALHRLGALASQTQRHPLAVDVLRQAIALAPTDPEIHNSLGRALKNVGQLDEAIAAYRQALALQPHLHHAFYNLGIALHAKGELNEAIAAFQEAIALHPDFPLAFNNLGNVLKARNRYPEALVAFRQAIALHPTFPMAYSNMGNVLMDMGQLDAAIAAFRHALTLHPAFPEALYNLGNALRDKGDIDEAIASYQKSIAIDSAFAPSHTALGFAMWMTGKLDPALAAYRQAMTLEPHNPHPHGNLAYTLLFHPGYDAHAIAQELRHWNQQHAALLHTTIHPFTHDRNPERPLRIGYVSSDFRDHVIGFNLLPLLGHHTANEFKIHCYSGVTRPDDITRQFRNYSHVWRDTAGLSDEQLADQIRADQIDILVDLSLHLQGNRLAVFSRKPAPVQVTFAGYPGSTGLQTIDYRLSDPYLDTPELSDDCYCEKTLRLPHSFWCYAPSSEEPAVNALPALSQGAITFGCLNNVCKIQEPTLRLWAKIMQNLPTSRLVLLAPLGSHRQHLASILVEEGIAPERLQFVTPTDRHRYLQHYHHIDIALDTLPYNGHTTSLDALWMGVPVITLVGHTGVGRAGYSQLMNLGLPELIAHTPEQFNDIATTLATDLPRLAQLRHTLRDKLRQSPLGDAKGFAHNIEHAFRLMWRTACATH